MRFLFSFFLFLTHYVQSQEHAWVYFKDKPNASVYLSNPNLMLTQKAIDRRVKQEIDIVKNDVPLDPYYIELVAASTGITIKARSKWMNAVHVLGFKTDIENLLNLSFVDKIEFANKNINNINPSIVKKTERTFKTDKLKSLLMYNYGLAQNQITMLELDKFHNAGFDGKGLQIAVLDGGFFGTNTAGAFSHLIDGNSENGEILGGYDYVHSSSNFYKQTGTTHGTQVLSTMGAIKENEFVGTSPKASYYLYVTEDAANETPLEESLWVEAAEKADSLGVDIINTSLGYSQFDDPKYNYTYADMNGATTFITRGATIAAQKGIVIVNSAGNSGNSAWKYITAPADANNILTVGAVNPNKSIASFSSFGPTADTRIKPETLAQGGSVYIVDENNTVKTSNGTSFSGPIIAGAAACLWQAYPNKTSLEIRQMIVENSRDFLTPTPQGGYGILKMKTLLPENLSFQDVPAQNSVTVNYLNTSKKIQITLYDKTLKNLKISIYSVLGKEILKVSITPLYNEIDVKDFMDGIYYLKYSCSDKIVIKTLIVTN